VSQELILARKDKGEEELADWMARDTGDYEAGEQSLRDLLKELDGRLLLKLRDWTKAVLTAPLTEDVSDELWAQVFGPQEVEPSPSSKKAWLLVAGALIGAEVTKEEALAHTDSNLPRKDRTAKAWKQARTRRAQDTQDFSWFIQFAAELELGRNKLQIGPDGKFSSSLAESWDAWVTKKVGDKAPKRADMVRFLLGVRTTGATGKRIPDLVHNSRASYNDGTLLAGLLGKGLTWWLASRRD